MSFGFGFGFPRGANAAAFSPLSLFTGGVQGAWYDPSDYSTLFQDSSGATPVTAVEQPVRLMMDKSQSQSWVDVTGAVWTRTAGDGVLSVSGDTITVTGATTATQITRTAGNIPLVPGLASMVVRADWTTATGVSVWVRGAPFPLSNGVTQTITLALNNSNLERLDVGTGTVTFTISRFQYWRGNHALAPNDLSRPVLRARYNLLTYSEQFDNAVWTKTLATVTPNDAIAPDGTQTADKVVFSGVTSEIFQSAGAGGTGSLAATGSVYIKGTAGETIQFYDGYTPKTPTVLTGNWQRLEVPVLGATRYVDISAANGATARTIWLWGADLRTGSSAGTYQRIAAATDYATAGFLPYLAFDGSDDSFSTGSINFSATDKMSVCAGVTKNTDTGTNVLVELSATVASNAGSFAVYVPNSGANYAAILYGSSLAGRNATTYTAPITNVLYVGYDIAQSTTAGEITAKVNGATPTLTDIAGPAGTGNFGNWPLYIGRRANTLLPFNGNLYQMVICGKALSASELASTEAYVAAKTGVTLLVPTFDYYTTAAGDFIILDNGDNVVSDTYYV